MAQGVSFVSARVKQSLLRYFREDWGAERREANAKYRFDTLKSAVRAFNNREIQRVNNTPDGNEIA